MADSVAEQVAATAGAAVENVVAAAAESVEAANARAAAAAEVGALITEAAVQREIAGDVSDLEDEVEEWRNELASVRVEMVALRETQTMLQQSLTTLVTMEISKLSLPSIPKQSSEPGTLPANPTHNPQDGADGHPEVAPELESPKKKFRVS